MDITEDELSQEIRRVDGNHSLGAGALAEALMPFLRAALTPAEPPTGDLTLSVIADKLDAEGRHRWAAKIREAIAERGREPNPEDDLIAALTPLANLPIGAELENDADLVLYKNAGRSITVSDVLAARDAIRKEHSKEADTRRQAFEECAKIAERRFTEETVTKNRKGEPYVTSMAAIYAAKQIAKAIRATIEVKPVVGEKRAGGGE